MYGIAGSSDDVLCHCILSRSCHLSCMVLITIFYLYTTYRDYSPPQRVSHKGKTLTLFNLV